MLFGEPQTSDNKVLSQLEEKLNAYVQELPVLGFNSGKYDLNAVKTFLFPYLVQHQPIKFTAKKNSNHMCLKTDFFKLLDISNYVAPYLFSYLSDQTYFSLFDQANKDLYHLIRDNNTGGPSIIFHRYREAGKTKIREAERDQAAELCQKIVGYDANALYLLAHAKSAYRKLYNKAGGRRFQKKK